MQVEALDPACFNLDPGWFSRIIGYIPGIGSPLKRYFSKYENAQTIINSIIQSLEMGREQLKRDNITLTEDQKTRRILEISRFDLQKQLNSLKLSILSFKIKLTMKLFNQTRFILLLLRS